MDTPQSTQAFMIGWPAATVICVVALAGLGSVLMILWKAPHKLARIRVNVLWLATLVAVLTLVFGNQLIGMLQRSDGTGSNTIEIVLSSLVGVGIGGLIAIAGQLVQDSDDGSSGNPSSNTTRPTGTEE